MVGTVWVVVGNGCRGRGFSVVSSACAVRRIQKFQEKERMGSGLLSSTLI